MEHTADYAQPPQAEDRSAGDLIKQLSEQVSVLVRDELKLAQLEMTRKSKQAGLGIGMLAAAASSPCTAWAACSRARSSPSAEHWRRGWRH